MSKILEKIIEPSKIYVGSIFKLKIKVDPSITYTNLLQRTYNNLETFTYKQVKGD